MAERLSDEVLKDIADNQVAAMMSRVSHHDPSLGLTGDKRQPNEIDKLLDMEFLWGLQEGVQLAISGQSEPILMPSGRTVEFNLVTKEEPETILTWGDYRHMPVPQALSGLDQLSKSNSITLWGRSESAKLHIELERKRLVSVIANRTSNLNSGGTN